MAQKIVDPPTCLCGTKKVRVLAKKSGSSKSYMRWRCPTCQRRRQRECKLRKYDEYRARERAGHQRRHRTNMQKVVDYLREHPCVDCGETDWMVLQFDHVRGKKSFTISAKITHYTWGKLVAEIAKCDIRCANCHMRKTIKERGFLTYIV